MIRAVVVGAGVGGLTTAALLTQAGLDVTVLEAHTYPGGCAGTYYHQGYRFDAGATLAGGFSPGGPMARLASDARSDLARAPNRSRDGRAPTRRAAGSPLGRSRPVGRRAAGSLWRRRRSRSGAGRTVPRTRSGG